MRMTAVPRSLWILWYQGLEEAPYIVRKCIKSWAKENPTWDIVILSKSNLKDYVQLDIPERILAKLSLAHQSDLVRLALLSQYGGVWADATTYCMRPLDAWIDGATASGFFAFYKPGRDRLISSWFMASQMKCPLTAKLYRALAMYWVENDFNEPNALQIVTGRILSKIFNRKHQTTRHWFAPVVTRLLKVYPYFAIHYMFERVIAFDEEAEKIWENTVKLSAVPPHQIQKYGFRSPLTPAIKEEIDQRRVPLYKLTWKCEHDRGSAGSVLYYLMEGERPR